MRVKKLSAKQVAIRDMKASKVKISVLALNSLFMSKDK